MIHTVKGFSVVNEAEVGIKIAGISISIISDMQMTPPYDNKQRNTEEPLDENERGE